MSDRRDEQDLAETGVEERRHVLVADERHRERDPHRQQRENPARKPSLRGQRTDEAPELHFRADVLDHPVEHLRRVRAHLALEPGDERDLLEVRVLHPDDDDLEGVLEIGAELLVGDHTLELGLGRLDRVGRDNRERPDQAVARAKRRGEHLEVVGKLIGERPPLAGDLAHDPRPDDQGHRQPGEDAEPADREAEDQHREDRPHRRQDHDLDGLGLDVGELQGLGQPSGPAGARGRRRHSREQVARRLPLLRLRLRGPLPAAPRRSRRRARRRPSLGGEVTRLTAKPMSAAKSKAMPIIV